MEQGSKRWIDQRQSNELQPHEIGESALLSPCIAVAANATKPTMKAWKEQNSLQFTSPST